MARGRKLSDAYVEIRADDSKLRPDVRIKATRVGREFGGALNKQLRSLRLDPIDMKVSPVQALAAIEETRRRLGSLAADADTVELRVKADDAIRQVDRFEKKLRGSGEAAGPAAATGFAASMGARLGPLMARLPVSAPLLGVVAAAGLSAAPLLSAALSAGVVGGVGVGGVVGGFALARKDERVAEAIEGMGNRIEGRLLRAGGVFVQPTLQGVTEIERAIDRVDVERILRDSSRYVPVLTRGVTSAIDDMGDAVEKLVANAGPGVQAISSGIARVGESLSTGLEGMADNGESSARALTQLFGVIDMGVDTTFRLVNMFAELYEIGERINGDMVLDSILKLHDWASASDDAGESARRTGSANLAMGESIRKAGDDAETMKVRQEALTKQQKALTTAQQNYSSVLDSFNPRASYTTQLIDGLRKAQASMTGGAVTATEATEAYEAALDSLSASVKTNGRSLSINTQAGRANRDGLEALLQSSNEMYYANIAQGQSTDSARKKHEARTKAIEREADRLGLNDRKTRDLIKTYGRIPGRKETDLIASGVNQIIIELKRVYLAQRALAEGKTINQVRYEGSAAMRSLLADGGRVPGHSPHSKADNITASVDGVPRVRLTANEWVHPVASVDYYGAAAMEAIQHRRVPREALAPYAYGGRVIAPVETSRYMRFPVNVRNAYVMQQEEALRRVAPVFGNWPSSPAAQRGDSGIWRQVVRLIKSGPRQGSFGNGYRPGDPKWHGSGRAVDWMGFNMDALASYLASKRPLELIHRTRRRDYAYTRGRNMGSFNQSLMNAHRNHIHIAMAEGGQVVPIRKVGTADTGRTTLQQGWNLIANNTGKPEPMSTRADEQLEVMQQMLDVLSRLAPRIGDVVGRHVNRAGTRADSMIGAQADLWSRGA